MLCRVVGTKRRLCTVRMQNQKTQELKPSLTDSLLNMPLPMAMSLMGYCEPALADEAVDAANQSSGFLGFTNAGTLIAFSPIVVYSVFYVYRATVNPKAKLQDLLFIAAACVVVANIASIVIFKKRIY
jgi:hypothetical protein